MGRLDQTIIGSMKTDGKTNSNPIETSQPQVRQAEIIDQIVKKIDSLSLNRAENSEIKIQLKPEFLGKMTIKLVVDDGVVTAKFTTDSNNVKQALEANMASLKQNLEAAGLKVEKTEVNVQLDNGGGFNGNADQGQQRWQAAQSNNQLGLKHSSSGINYGIMEGVEDLTYETNTDQHMIMNNGRLDYTV